MISHKSYAEYVLGLYGAMFSDIASQDPGLRIECERDYKRLLSAIEQMGLPFFLETLPAFGKHFDMCLSNECLTRSGLAHFRPYSRKSPIPRLFKGLMLRIFDVSGVLKSDPDVASIKAVRQLCSAVKRLRVDCPEPKVWKQIDEFFKIDGEVMAGSLCWDNSFDFDPSHCRDLKFGDHIYAGPAAPLFEYKSEPAPLPYESGVTDAIQFVADVTCSELGRYIPTEWGVRHGPGAVSDLSPDGYKYHFRHWPDKLEKCFPYSDFAFANWDELARLASDEDYDPDLRHEPPSKLIAVPKAYSGPRLICSEPTAHQWCQQSIRDYLMTRVSKTSLRSAINFRSQTLNQALARVASKSGSHSTIDLSSASDRISPWLVERLFRLRPELLDCMHSVRTRWVTQRLDKKSPKFSMLRKFSTQGSALTFPVQTYLFATLCIGAVLYKRGLLFSIANIRKCAREVQVYGDDLIVPVDCHDLVLEVLTHFRLKVNPAKTFRNGKFRESCGYDAYDGTNVSKVSVISVPAVSKPEAVLSAVDTHNNLLNAGWECAARFVREQVEKLGRYGFDFVDPQSGAIGWHTLDGLRNPRLKRRWNPDLQRSEVRTTLPIGGARRIAMDSSAMVLQYFTECHTLPEPETTRLGKSSLRDPLKLRWVWAPSENLGGGSLRAALTGRLA